MIEIEIDGRKLQVEPGSTIIEIADKVGIPIPRFCYHKKLSIAANCRMCLVEVEKAPKPLPACATPVTAGMKVSTLSSRTKEAQRSVMEFLLINHPLDCPICDQGGECELQDVSMVYGADTSRLDIGKRSVKDDNLGPLIATEMTRCIHCTRCVRFGQEIAGLRELGATGRNENMEITTYVKHSMKSELSGNIIDLCPVGALTSKPYRFRARPWELDQTPSIAPHDCVGSNIYLHTLRNTVMRVAPRDNESLNEVWLSDRDRFSYLGTNSPQRLTKPMLKKAGKWEEIDWTTAFSVLQEKLNLIKQQFGAEQIAALVSPSATLEEFYLLQKLMRGLGSNNIDHRLHQSDFSDQNFLPLFPQLDLSFEELENQELIVLIGSNVQREQPILGHRIRKATLKGAKVISVNPIDFAFNFAQEDRIIISPEKTVKTLAGIAKALMLNTGVEGPAALTKLLENIQPGENEKKLAKFFATGKKITVLLGALANNHPQAAAIRSLTQLITQVCEATLGYLTEGANSAGAWLAGAVPHRTVAGNAVSNPGLSVLDALTNKLKAYLLFNVEPELDCACSAVALEAMQTADFVAAFTSYQSEELANYADLLLPIAAFSENSGTYVNVQGSWQSFLPAIKPLDEIKPGWKILRVLGNQLNLPGFDYVSAEEIHTEIQKEVNSTPPFTSEWYVPQFSNHGSHHLTRITEWPMYAVDNIVRHAVALQQAASNDPKGVVIHPELAKKLAVTEGQEVTVKQHQHSRKLPVLLSSRIPENCVLLHGGRKESTGLGEPFGAIELYV